MNKIVFKGDGTLERGKRIIAELERLGGVNSMNLSGNNYILFYFIDQVGVINYSHYTYLPSGYTLTELPEENDVSELNNLKKENEELKDNNKKLETLITMLQEKYDENGYNLPSDIKVGRIISTIDCVIKLYYTENEKLRDILNKIKQDDLCNAERELEKLSYEDENLYSMINPLSYKLGFQKALNLIKTEVFGKPNN
jgi:hypothetical protein